MTDLETGTPQVRWVRRPGDAIALVAGLIVLALGMIAVRDGNVPAWEEDLFDSMNGLPEWLYPAVWPFQQLGALVIGPVVALIAALTRRYRLAVAALLVTASKLLLEEVVKAMVSRERPGTSIGADIETRGDVSVSGESFVSGHATLAAALAGVIAPYLSGRWRILPWVLVALVMFGRVYVGAHNPLDVVCGAALGVAIASAINLVLAVPAHDSDAGSSHG